jgi:hypothetical protein
VRVLEIEVEKLGISDALYVEASLPCPQLHAAFVIGVEDPHDVLSFKTRTPLMNQAELR